MDTQVPMTFATPLKVDEFLRIEQAMEGMALPNKSVLQSIREVCFGLRAQYNFKATAIAPFAKSHILRSF